MNLILLSRSTSIIVVGGYEADIISWKERPQFTSTEILNENMDGWYQGPDLPFGIADSAIVEDSNGGVILVGGNSQKGGILNTLFRLSHSGNIIFSGSQTLFGVDSQWFLTFSDPWTPKS